MTKTWTVSIDTGGTFTDAVARSAQGQVVTAKVASTPDDPSRALAHAVTALRSQGLPLEDVSLLCHGTTVATNAILVDDLADVVLVTTQGFRDVMGYRQGSRPDVYSLEPRRPQDIVPRDSRVEAVERIGSRGQVLVELTDAEVERVVARVVALAPQAVAVSCLFSYLNPEHEERLGAALAAALPATPVTLSSRVVREFREYPRTATTTINAALRPVVGDYLARAEEAVARSGLRAPFVVMQSNGGCVPAGRAAEQAHQLVLSGPAGGVAALLDLADRLGTDDLISLDMGGTSTDVCLVRGRRAPFAREQRVQDHTLLAPTIDIHTIGAGGGSIAWVDTTRRLRVGPRSAGAVPGPACYGRGGEQPTITDAHAVLGTLGAGVLAGGLELDRGASTEAMRRVGTPLGLTPVEAAEAVLAIGLAHMVQAVRKVSVERGLDPGEFSLVPFGGAGPLHAGLLLRHLGLRSVIVPCQPGLFSADGLLVAGLRFDDSRTVLTTCTHDALDDLAGWYEQSVSAGTKRLVADGVDAGRTTVQASVDCRYRGQGYELTVPLDGHDRAALDSAEERFHRAHEELYGHASRGEEVELVTVRVAVTGHVARDARPADATTGTGGDSVVAHREVVVPGEGTATVAVHDRRLLAPGATFTGPAIVVQMDSTTFVLGGQSVTVARSGELIVTEVMA